MIRKDKSVRLLKNLCECTSDSAEEETYSILGFSYFVTCISWDFPANIILNFPVMIQQLSRNCDNPRVSRGACRGLSSVRIACEPRFLDTFDIASSWRSKRRKLQRL